MKWLRGNAVLALGIALPLLLMLAFVGVRALQGLNVDPPAHALVFSVSPFSPYGDYFSVRVDDEGKMAVSFKIDEIRDYEPAEKYILLYKYDPLLGETETYKLTAPAHPVPKRSYKIKLPEDIAGLTLSAEYTAPDGYYLDNASTSYGNVMTDIFGYNGQQHSSFYLVKKAHRVAIPGTFEYGTHNFIGWAVQP